ncbi:MAG: glycoside hydrolase family 3 protein [Candidatus Cryptobacteroides sp.]
MMKEWTLIAAATMMMAASCTNHWQEIPMEGYVLVKQSRGAELGYSPESGISLLVRDGFVFKDLNRNGELDVYEDWRRPLAERAEDLAASLSIDEIAGLMLYSEHQAVPTDSAGYWSSTYNGVSLTRSGLPHSAISDKQKKFLSEDNLRAVLLVRAESPRIAAEWNNNLQAFCEGIGHGIPVNISSDPRHEAEAFAEFNAGSGGTISQWPCQLGLAATFDPELVREFGRVASAEYRALGIATALSPQADLGTEPRWFRFYGTFGEDPVLARDMVKAYVDGFQTSEGKSRIEGSWGYGSVNCMTKHWPGGGSGEGGRDAHYCFGKYSVYPGNDLEEQLVPFLGGAFDLDGGTDCTSAIMPYYTISYNIDPSGRNVGNSYSSYIVNDLLREKYGYDGVVCTDWAITHDYQKVEDATGKCWGYENATEAERHFAVLEAGVDQFGGNNEKQPVLDAYSLWVDKYGEASAQERFRKSARRLLMNMFRTGLFDNPYVDPARTEMLVGCPEYMAKGLNAQLRSVVMLKNRNAALPQDRRAKVWFPMIHKQPSKGFFGNANGSDTWEYPMDTALVARYFDLADTPEEADFAFVYANEPQGGHGYDVADRDAGGNGYVPISLQYGDYTASSARPESIAGGDPLEPSSNRSYRGKTVTTSNCGDMEAVIEARRVMGDKPVIVAVSVLRPFVPAEIEPYADGLLVAINVQHQAVLEIVSGAFEPQGLLPMQLPLSMDAVEKQCEDRPHDMECYRDSEGNVYDFAFGMNWNGVISDDRVKRYALPDNS